MHDNVKKGHLLRGSLISINKQNQSENFCKIVTEMN